MVQKYIIDKNYEICQGCRENYISKDAHQCYECELSTAEHNAAGCAMAVKHLLAFPWKVRKEQPMLPNPRHKDNQ